jgi:hypothetical protein
MELLDYFGVADRAGNLPDALSGGQQQRVVRQGAGNGDTAANQAPSQKTSHNRKCLTHCPRTSFQTYPPLSQPEQQNAS